MKPTKPKKKTASKTKFVVFDKDGVPEDFVIFDSSVQIRDYFEEMVDDGNCEADDLEDRFIVFEVLREVEFKVKSNRLNLEFSK